MRKKPPAHQILTMLAALLCVAVFSKNAAAQTPLNQKQTNNFYYNCLDKMDMRVRRENQKTMCACAAATLMQVMTLEEVTDTVSDDPALAGQARHKMLRYVYGPCMHYVLGDRVGIQCLQDGNINMLGTNIPKEEICSCVAETTTRWFEDIAPADLDRILRNRQDITDPVRSLMESKDMKMRVYQSMTSCITKKNK